MWAGNRGGEGQVGPMPAGSDHRAALPTGTHIQFPGDTQCRLTCHCSAATPQGIRGLPAQEASKSRAEGTWPGPGSPAPCPDPRPWGLGWGLQDHLTCSRTAACFWALVAESPGFAVTGTWVSLQAREPQEHGPISRPGDCASSGGEGWGRRPGLLISPGLWARGPHLPGGSRV